MLVVHPGALGDVLLALPALRAIRLAFPSHELTLLTSRDVAGLLHTCGEVDRGVALEGPFLSDLLSGAQAVSPDWRAWLTRCRCVVGWLQDPDGALRNTLSRLGVRRVVLASPVEAGPQAGHQAARYLAVLGDLARSGAPETPMRLSEQDNGTVSAARLRLRPDGWMGPVAMVHPGSGSVHKCVKPKLLAALVERLRQDGILPLLLVGPADARQAEAVLAACSQRPLVLDSLDLQALAGVLAQVDLFVGHDSGVTHLAAWLGRPVVALFGPTDAGCWSPQGPHVRVLTGERCRCDGWDQIRACVDKPCLPVSLDSLLGACRLVRSQAPSSSPSSFP
ncbi:MAG: glycosyltransferase family 9 protein [Nitrospirales bacterium]